MATKPIGVFDSGVGGLTVVRALHEQLPGEDILYLGDTARVPYGSKSEATVNRYTQSCARFLLGRGAKMVLIACNTASAYGLSELSSWLPVPVIDAVRPGAKAAADVSKTGAIAVLGTRGTVNSGAYIEAIHASRPDANVFALACPLLVPLAEEGWTHDATTIAVVTRYLSQLKETAPETDTILLGCTHYPLLSEAISDVAKSLFGHAVQIVDSASNMAKSAKALVSTGSKTVGNIHICLTDDSRFSELAESFLGRAPDHVELIDL